MKLIDRQLVEGTEPKVYFGHRTYKDAQGQQKVTNTYFAEYSVFGQQHQRSLGTRNKQLAIRRAHEIISRIEDGELRPAGDVQIAELARQYLETLVNKSRAPTTITKYTYILATFVAWTNAQFRRPAALFREQHFWEWHKSMIDDGYSEHTRSDRAIVIKQMFKWAAGKAKQIATNPVADAHVPEPTSAEQPCFTPDQVAAILDGADPHERAIFAVMAYLGLRFGEVRDLRWSAVNMPPDSPGFVTISLGGSNGTTKGRRVRRIPLHAELRRILEPLPRVGERVFYSRPSSKYPNGDHVIRESHLLLGLKRLCRRLGFENPNQYKLHTFRHAFASMLARNNVAYKYALEFMGHRDSTILDLYYRQFDDVAHQAIGTIRYGVSPIAPVVVNAAAISEI